MRRVRITHEENNGKERLRGRRRRRQPAILALMFSMPMFQRGRHNAGESGAVERAIKKTPLARRGWRHW